MRKLMLLLALIGASALFLGAAPSPASAANCTSMHFATYWDGYLNFPARLTNCTGVDKVEFKRSNGCCVYTFNETGWGDGTEHDAWGWPGNHPAPSAYNVDDSVQNIANYNSIADITYRVIAWCGGQTHWVFTQNIWRIHSTGGSWGPWHWTRSVGYQIIC